MKKFFTNHCKQLNTKRQDNINQLGLGEILHELSAVDPKRNKEYRYRFTSTGIMQVLDAKFDEDVVITQYPAKPNTIKRYWKDAPQWYLSQAYELVCNGMMD